jgi:predicted ATPase
MTEVITGILVKGFKSIAEPINIEVRPLTILAGANSSGKSSIMQPLLMLKQTLEAPYDPGPLLIDGPNVRFTSADQFLSRFNGKIEEKFTVGLEVDNVISFEETFISKPQAGMEIAEITYKDEKGSTTLWPDMTREEAMVAFPPWADAWSESSPKGKKRLGNSEWNVVRDRCFLELKVFFTKNNVRGATDLSKPFTSNLLSLIHVPALRGNPERNYRKTSVGPMFPGTFGTYVASLISHWQATKDPRLKDLGRALELLGLTWKVGARQVDDISVEVVVGRLPHKAKAKSSDVVNIADVGFGLSQTLPVVVALLSAQPGQLVYIEQPEIHLHPRAEVAMAQVLADAARRGVRVVAETHSSLLITGIQTLVAEGKLSPEIIKLHWFKRREEDGITEVFSADLDEAGAFGEWPEDFADVELKAQSRYMDAAEQRLRHS